MKRIGEYEEYKLENFALIDENEAQHETVKRKRRIDHHKYRELTFSVYGQCAITGETFSHILEACHIQPYINEHSNHIQNSILLRSDIHSLFDKGFVTIDDTYRVRVSPLLESDYYQQYDGKKIHLPEISYYHPSRDALADNRKHFIDTLC